MTSLRIDRILLCLGAVLILFSSYQLFFASNENNSGLKLGTLTSTLSVVKTKSALSLDWRDASSGNDLTENQLIYTDSSSSAEVVFTEGSVLEIGENSLVKLRSAGKEQSMDLSKGFIRAKLDGDKPLKVQMNGEDYLVSGKDADIQINIQDKNGEIGVLSGEVKVVADGISENLNSSTALEIEGDKVTKKAIYYKTLLPEKSSIRYVLNSSAPVTFTWEPSEESTVIISKKPNLANPISVAGSSGVSQELAPGLYYYKIENDKGTSLVSTFRIIQESSPVILRPRDGEEVSILEDAETKVLLQWKNEGNLNYILETNDSETKSFNVSGGSALVSVMSGKPFSWRVKINDSSRPDAIWSSWQNLKLTFIPKPLLPMDLIPHEVDYQTYDKPNEKIDLQWKNSSNVELELKSPNGESIFQKVPRTFWTYTATAGGTYSWRVRSIDSYLRTSEWTEWRTFTIEDLSQKKSAEGIQRIQLKKPDQAVTFDWETKNGSTTIFELAKDPGFKTIVKKIEGSKTSASVNIPEVGTYYWRSREFKADGTYNVSEPKRVVIEPVPAPEKPEKLPDMEVPLEELPATTTFIQDVFNFIILSAHADETKGVVKIDLPVKEEAKGYVVRIYRDEKLKDLLFEEELQTKHFEWLNAKPGTYYWQYAVIDFWERKSLFSDPARLIVKNELVALAEKPKLLAPIRAVEVEQKDLVLKWTESQHADKYVVEVSDSEDFKKVISKKEVKSNEASFTELSFEPKLHYWRVTALNKKKKETGSNTGRFTILPPLEKIVIADIPKDAPFIKEWKSRAFVAWAPSMDTYKFSDGESAKIDGTTKMAALVSGTLFKNDYAFNGEVLRQTGEVFKGESYLFQRLLIDGIKTWKASIKHRYGVGLALGQSSGQGYEVDASSNVKSKSVSGLSYGPAIRNYYSFNESWEMQGKLFYLLGEIKQLDFGADFIRHYKSYLLIGGVSYASRDYELNSGKQTSMKFTFGIGKEF
jgi:FecR protein